MTNPILPYSPNALAKAAALLVQGRLVGVPTETVYGLAGDATNETAIAAIFAAKGRPTYNPLIVHVQHLAMAAPYVCLSAPAQQLAEAFWPGPLTMVLPRTNNSTLCTLVSAGLDTLAIRCPNARTALNLLAMTNRPFAAPSANPSGGLSPTSAAHVEAGLGDKIDLIIDDGPCTFGVESTIVQVHDDTLTLLRPGSICPTQLAQISGLDVRPPKGGKDVTPLAPGMMASHYAPKAQLRLNVTKPTADEAYLGFGPYHREGLTSRNLSSSGDLAEAAHNLFAFLHQFDKTHDQIAIAPIPTTGPGLAINDRLARAAAPRPG